MKQTTETTVGIFLLSGIALICGLIIFYGQMGNFFTPVYHFTVEFPDASELIKGSDVYLSGAVIGKVMSNPRAVPGRHHVEVDIQIRQDMPLRKNLYDADHHLVKTGDSFTVGSSGLLGDRFVDVRPYEYDSSVPDSEKAPLILDGDRIDGTPTTDISSIMESAKPLVDNTNQAVEEVKTTLAKLNGEILTGATTDDIKATIANLKDTLKNANIAIQHADKMIQDADAVIKSTGGYVDQAKEGHGLINELLTDPKLAKNVTELVQNLKEHGILWYSDTNGDKSEKSEQKKMKVNLSVVLVAAGRSSRMGFDKIMTILGDRPLILHTLERIQTTDRVSEVILVVRSDIEEDIRSMIEPWQQFCPIRVVAGGANRQDSVAAGLAEVAPAAEYVMIHDAARIFVTSELIDSVLEAAIEMGAATAATPCTDSLKRANADGTVSQTVDRADIWLMQTPQIFRTSLLRDCYIKALSSGSVFTDDTAIVEFCGHPVKLVNYAGVNFKVTTPLDWKLALAHMYLNEPDCIPGQQLRKYIHDINNHLTPLMGYSYLILKELKDGPNGKKFATNIQSASERCQEVAIEMQKLVRQLFPRKEE